MVEELLIFNEAKKYLKTSRATLYRFATSGRIPAVKMVGRWRFRKERLDTWLRSQENSHSSKRKKTSHAR